MVIYYKKQTHLVRYLESKISNIKVFKKPSWLQSVGFGTIVYPDIYFHTGSVNSLSKLLLEKSKIVIVNSPFLRDKLVNDLKLDKEKFYVIYPAVDIPKFKKKEVKIPFYEKYNIPQEDKIIYFTAKNFQRSGFDSFCDIISKVEQTNFKAVVSTKDPKELTFAKETLKSYELEEKVLIVEDEIFDVADLFLLPTTLPNISINVIKAMRSKCAVFLPESNYAVEFVDIFSIINLENSQNSAYKIDMILRVNEELKKIQKANYALAKKLTYSYQEGKLDQILEKLEKNIAN